MGFWEPNHDAEVNVHRPFQYEQTNAVYAHHVTLEAAAHVVHGVRMSVERLQTTQRDSQTDGCSGVRVYGSKGSFIPDYWKLC